MITQTKETQQALSISDALQILKDGNARFVDSKREDRAYADQVKQTSTGQFPYAVVLSCIDSRVPAEIVFDQGIGDLFSVRVAGNVINGDVLGSMEYGCKVAGSKVLVVMGHTSCGAVNSACQGVQLGNITGLLSKIQPAVDKITAKHNGLEPHQFDEVSHQNVLDSIAEIKAKSPILAEMEADGDIAIVGASYDVHSGKVTFF